MSGKCVVGGCSTFPDVQNRLVMHSRPFLDNERPKARKRQNKQVDFEKKKVKWELTPASAKCSRHFTEGNYVHWFSFVGKVAKKPIMPKLKRDKIGVYCAICSGRSSEQKASFTESVKRHEWVVRIAESETFQYISKAKLKYWKN